MDSLFRFAKSVDTNSIANIEWIKLFKDTVLQRLVNTGLKNNYDIRIAFARIEESRAAFKQARGQQWPQISAQAVGGWQNQALPGGTTTEYSTLSAVGQISWEIDLWGKAPAFKGSSTGKPLCTNSLSAIGQNHPDQ